MKGNKIVFGLCFFYGFSGISNGCKEFFLIYGTIEEEVYVCQPPGFEDPDYPDKVYKVVKALYGLHQAPRAWYETLANYLLGNGFQRGKIDQTLFIKRQKGDILLVQVYVDDIIFGSTNKELCTGFEKLMKISLWYSRDSPFKLVAYTDSDYARVTQDRKSTTKGCQFLGNRLISWQCKKQTVVATSTTEVEYVAAAIVVDKLLMDIIINCVDLLVKHIEYLMMNASPLKNWLRESGDEAVHKELGDRMERAATTASSLEAKQDSDTILGDVDAQTRFKTTSKQSNDPPPVRGYTLRSRENSLKLLKLMELCTQLSNMLHKTDRVIWGVDLGIPIDSLQTPIPTQPSSSRSQKKQSKRKQRKDTVVTQEDPQQDDIVPTLQ
ncbi:putative ribonuclease H-like domain-containing protein [Tanacetum coccineum]